MDIRMSMARIWVGLAPLVFFGNALANASKLDGEITEEFEFGVIPEEFSDWTSYGDRMLSIESTRISHVDVKQARVLKSIALPSDCHSPRFIGKREDRVFVGCKNGPLSIDPHTGFVYWRASLNLNNYLVLPLAIGVDDAEYSYFVPYSGVINTSPEVIVLDLKTGWTVSIPYPQTWNPNNYRVVGTVLSDNTALFSQLGEEELVRIGPDGKVLNRLNLLGRLNSLQCKHADAKLVCGVASRRNLELIEIMPNFKSWSRVSYLPPSGYFQLTNDSVYIVEYRGLENGKLARYDYQGNLLWSSLEWLQWRAPFASEDLLFSDDLIISRYGRNADTTEGIQAINKHTGKREWSVPLPEAFHWWPDVFTHEDSYIVNRRGIALIIRKR